MIDSPGPAPQTEAILDLLREHTGTDLRFHRRAMVERRLAQRVARIGLGSIAEYLARLRGDAEERQRLLAHLTIKVSAFFRDAAVFTALADVVVPDLRARGGAIRCWSAGCARGEEPWSLAFTLAAGGIGDWSVLGTDVDGEALAFARAGAYGRRELEPVPAAFRAAWFREDEHVGTVVDDVARRVTFARDDLLGAARASGRFDLVACRNVLIYFDRPRQSQVLARLLGALAPGGYLVLGKAEWPTPEAAARLVMVDRAARVFRLKEERQA